jgi:hypothetical protein
VDLQSAKSPPSFFTFLAFREKLSFKVQFREREREFA